MWFSTVAGTLHGAIDGSNCAFLAAGKLRSDAQVIVNGLVRPAASALDNGYNWQGSTLHLREAPVPGDIIAIWQPDNVSDGTSTNINGPRPSTGLTSSLSPTLTGTATTPMGAVWALPQGSATILRP